MYRLDRAHSFLKKRLTTQFPQLQGNYSHRLEKGGKTHYALSILHQGEELMTSKEARGRMKVRGKLLEQAEILLRENPTGRFALVESRYGAVPFLFVAMPPQWRIPSRAKDSKTNRAFKAPILYVVRKADIFCGCTLSLKAAKTIKLETPGATIETRALRVARFGQVAGALLSLTGGASKGGLARSQKLTAKRRREIAVKANAARWAKKLNVLESGRSVKVSHDVSGGTLLG